MKRTLFFALAASLALAACGGAEDQPTKPAVNKTADTKAAPAAPSQPKTDAQIKKEQQQVQQTVEQAMAAIPPELREKHQAAFNCTIERNNKLPPAEQKQIGVDTIRSITDQLKANPNATICG